MTTAMWRALVVTEAATAPLTDADRQAHAEGRPWLTLDLVVPCVCGRPIYPIYTGGTWLHVQTRRRPCPGGIVHAQPRPGRRVRRSRARGAHLGSLAVVVSRPGRWGNPFRIGQTAPPEYGGEPIGDRLTAVAAYTAYLRRHPNLVAQARRELTGFDLACWCPLDEPCHADVLLTIATPTAP